MKTELMLCDHLTRQRAEEMLRLARRKQLALIENARRTWETHFAGRDSSDACVRVRIHSAPPAAARLVA